jgi:CubicO group peptidase (beta-lactamase class C family)
MKVIYFIAFFCILPNSIWSQNASLRKQIEKIIKYDVEGDLRKVPGFTVAMIDNDHTIIETFGVDPLKGTDLQGNEIFEIANISKALTFEVCSFLNSNKIISLEAPLNDMISQEYVNPRLSMLTLNDLLNIKNVFPNIVSGYGLIDIEGFHQYKHMDSNVLLKLYKNYYQDEDLLTNVYSNVDYAFIQLLIENQTRKDFQSIIDETINYHLDSKFFFTKFEQYEDVVTSGIKRGGGIGKSWAIDNFATSLGVKASVNDLIQFARYKIEKHSHLTPNDWEVLHDNQQETWNPQVKAFEGMFLLEINNHIKVLASNGHSDIHSAFIAIAPITNTAVIVLANSSIGTHDLGMLILRMINNNWKRKANLQNVK